MMKHSSRQFGGYFWGFGRQNEKFSLIGACIRRNFTPCIRTEDEHKKFLTKFNSFSLSRSPYQFSLLLPYISNDFSTENLGFNLAISYNWYFLSSHYLLAWLCIDIMRRKCLLITPRTERVNWSTGLMDFEKKFLWSLKRNEIAQQIFLIPKMQKKKPVISLTLYTLTSNSPYCSLHISKGANKEKLFSNQELLQLVIISFLLMTLMCDSGMIL